MDYNCDPNEVVQYIEERIICIICREIANQPQSCTICTAVLCKACAELYPTYVVNETIDYKICPSCKSPTIFFNNAFLKYLIYKYKVKCPDCLKEFTSRDYHTIHSDICEERHIICELCSKIFKRKEIHICDFVKCEYCSLLLKKDHYLIHLKDLCFLAPTRCAQCDDVVIRNNIEYHINNYCTKTELSCIYCKSYFYRYELDNHHLICQDYILKCDFCRNNYKRSIIHVCEYKECDLCNDIYKKIDENKHKNNDCPDFILKCEICDKLLCRKEMQIHVFFEHKLQSL